MIENSNGTAGAALPAGESRRGGGPRTTDGKARSSRNAVSHGLRSERFTLLAWEDGNEYRALRESVLDDLAPEGALEEVLAEKVVDLLWRDRRAFGYERAALEQAGLESFRSMARVLRIEREKEEARVQREDARQELNAQTGRPNDRGDFYQSEEAKALLSSRSWPFDGKDAPPDAARWPNPLFEDEATTGFDRLVLRYQTSIENRLYRALKELHRLQDRRAGRVTPALDVTVDIHGEGELPNELPSVIPAS